MYGRTDWSFVLIVKKNNVAIQKEQRPEKLSFSVTMDVMNTLSMHGSKDVNVVRGVRTNKLDVWNVLKLIF